MQWHELPPKGVWRIVLFAASRLRWATIEPGKAADTFGRVLLVVAGVLAGVPAALVDAGELIGAAVGRKEGMGSVWSCCMRTSDSGDERCIGETVDESVGKSSVLLFTGEQFVSEAVFPLGRALGLVVQGPRMRVKHEALRGLTGFVGAIHARGKRRPIVGRI